jgi:hypothetical protein
MVTLTNGTLFTGYVFGSGPASIVIGKILLTVLFELALLLVVFSEPVPPPPQLVRMKTR